MSCWKDRSTHTTTSRNSGAEPSGVSFGGFHWRILSCSWPGCPEGGCRSSGKGRNPDHNTTCLVSPNTRLFPLECGHSWAPFVLIQRKKQICCEFPVCLTRLPDVAMVCFLGCLAPYTFFLGRVLGRDINSQVGCRESTRS